jgi:hypothetical protein
MALALGHRQLLIFSEKGAPNVGMVKFMVQNRPCFSTDDELLEQIRNDVKRERWRPKYSRFLQAKKIVEESNVPLVTVLEIA